MIHMYLTYYFMLLNPRKLYYNSQYYILYALCHLLTNYQILQKDDRIEVITRTASDFDWWEGRISGKTGIFPGNYIKIVG